MKRPPFRRILFVCCNERDAGEAACANRGAAALQKRLKEHMKSKGLQDRCRVARSLCLGQCALGPNICVMPDDVWLHGVTENDLAEIQAVWIDSLAD